LAIAEVNWLQTPRYWFWSPRPSVAFTCNRGTFSKDVVVFRRHVLNPAFHAYEHSWPWLHEAHVVRTTPVAVWVRSLTKLGELLTWRIAIKPTFLSWYGVYLHATQYLRYTGKAHPSHGSCTIHMAASRPFPVVILWEFVISRLH